MSESETPWYDTRWGRRGLWGLVAVTLLGVVASVGTPRMQVPLEIYLFGFLGATVYAFTSLAKQFDRAERYRLKLLCRTVAVLPLAAGVYLLAFAFPGVSGELEALAANSSTSTTVRRADRLVAGLVFLAGIYVSATLQALGGLAERLLGTDGDQGEPLDASDEERESGGEAETDAGDGSGGDDGPGGAGDR